VIFQPELETLPRAELEQLQADRLRERFGVEREQLAEQPFATKAQLRDAYPFGLVRVPLADCVRIHASSGTHGRATIVAYTRGDIDVWADCCARSIAAAGGGPETVVHVAYGYGLFTGGLGLHYGAERLGCTTVPASVGNTPRQVQLIEDLGAEILCCTPSYALTIADHVEDPARLRLKAGIFGGEPWTEGLREEIEASLRLKAVDIYGLSEVMGPGVSFECVEARDGAHVSEDHFLVEVVDPESGVPVDDGDVGELVFTTLTKEALPLLRYRTGDLASLTREPCMCGRTLARMSRVKGRVDDMLIVRGVNLFPSEVERVLTAQPQLAPHYQLVIERPGRLDELTVEAEVRDGERVTDELEQRVRRALTQTLGLSARVTLLPPQSIARSEGKALRVIDRRER
jgi:phenylacetate-CoA ligase